MNVSEPKWMKHVKDIEKHLEINEKWLKTPEARFTKFNKEALDWEKEFLHNIGGLESFLKDLENKMENW
ncbi:hypothetical protein [Oceanobacillus kapialis]|uniref:Uncharacterized protein n=1 Tax=Oceanobacillus kapialis TaxID=481353 RepID=A0ABW5Q292_9BACI